MNQLLKFLEYIKYEQSYGDSSQVFSNFFFMLTSKKGVTGQDKKRLFVGACHDLENFIFLSSYTELIFEVKAMRRHMAASPGDITYYAAYNVRIGSGLWVYDTIIRVMAPHFERRGNNL